jgi:hypothetical protein
LLRYLSLVAVCLAACRTPEAAVFDAERPWRQPGDVIDSILPMEEYERRFRSGLPAVTEFTHGAPDRDALASRFLAAVEARDSVALARLAVSRGEFAWLVFPHHRYRLPPYELDPGIFWMQLTASSSKGLARVLERHGGQRLVFRGIACTADTVQFTGGSVRGWSDCTLDYQASDSLLTRRLFGTVVERDGAWKLLGFANDF